MLSELLVDTKIKHIDQCLETLIFSVCVWKEFVDTKTKYIDRSVLRELRYACTRARARACVCKQFVDVETVFIYKN